MLKTLRLTNFRSFPDFTVSFRDGAFLVGPNNAGKSTILTSLRIADALLRHAYQRKADVAETDNGISILGYPVNLRDFLALRDSLRHEFGTAETRLELQWRDGGKLVAVWPAEDEDIVRDGFFYLHAPGGFPIHKPAQARAAFPSLGVIPILAPTEHTEKLLADKYVRENVSGRLSSRHFRNQLRQLQDSGQLQAFLDWAKPWLGDLRLDRLGRHLEDDGMVVEAFFFEGSSRVPKEIAWAGDGIQVWLQILFHIFRVKDLHTIILDEPEVYLHPDLQRRLVHLLESTEKQAILATHSAEIIAESDGRLTTMIDKSRKNAGRTRTDADFEMLTSTLGTAFNLRLAKALRSKVAVFVEGHDMAVLRRFAKTLGLDSVERESGLTIIPLQGYSNWGHVAPFEWLCNQLLPDAIHTFVVLDRDYRSDSVRSAVIAEFEAVGITGHVWSRKELESYLLQPSVISRISGLDEAAVIARLNGVTEALGSEVFGRLLDERIKTEKSGSNHAVAIASGFKTEFDELWENSEYRLTICPPKKVVSRLNEELQKDGLKPVSMTALARAHRQGEIPEEMRTLLEQIEARCTSLASA